MHRRALAALLTLAVWPPRDAAAQGRPVLRVTGTFAGVPGREAVFDLPRLEGLGTVPLVTRTAWTGSAPQHFSGVPLARVLEAVRAEGDSLRAVALNDYAVTLPVEDATRHGAILATRHDGVPMRVRDRGPIWLLYPWTERPELDTPVFRERAIWQLAQIHVG
ncbi:molybdopterin-dependent oxidoreductase [Falsiroseomonas sp. E2-1-a20]|uniref:molybdopterin-dependent oxidoreductase n=1 Tax=Falsiroseomonas sp. E2-1-a20 TaxID=3239300 RepID=UPI003F38FA20